ncbi:MAG: glutamyl-tRNA reductase [Candidatus Marinimicrobia bacterium]|nr:glutamyl-tRNA reductase [Candidatus Neomarinimicrobiota bacterium]
MNKLTLLGSDYNHAPISELEKLSASDKYIDQIYTDLIESYNIDEVIILSTCNRFELYIVSDDKDIENIISNYVLDLTGTALLKNGRTNYVLKGESAVDHLFSVSAGIKSQIIGEPEILGQVKSSLRKSREGNASGSFLLKLFESAIRTGKRVRTRTNIAKGNASYASAALMKASEVIGSFDGKKVILLGTGKIGVTVSKYLKSLKLNSFYIASRNKIRAKSLSEKYGGIPISFNEVDDLIPEVDCLISATNVNKQIINRSALERLGEFKFPKVIIDLGMPRNVDPDIAKIKGIYLFNISNLDKSIYKSIQLRKQSVGAAEEIVKKEVKSFRKWHRKYMESDISKSLIEHFNIVKEEVLAVNSHKMSEKEFKQVEKITSLLVKRLLHQPLSFLKNDDSPHREMLLRKGVLNKMFGLQDQTNGR